MDKDEKTKENPLIFREKPYYTKEEQELYYKIAIDECLKQGAPELAEHYRILLAHFLETKDKADPLTEFILNCQKNKTVDENV